VLHVTQSAYLAQSARALYDAHGFESPAQDAEFLSYREFLETLQVPPCREAAHTLFNRYRQRLAETIVPMRLGHLGRRRAQRCRAGAGLRERHPHHLQRATSRMHYEEDRARECLGHPRPCGLGIRATVLPQNTWLELP